jgi:DNA polymerase-4
MRPSSNVTIRSSVENQSWLLGAEIAPLCARPHTKRVNSPYARLCPPFEPSAFAPAPSFCPRISSVIGQCPDRRGRSSTDTPTSSSLSLDEAYLDVTKNKTGISTATQVARTIREQIRTELSLTASAGVAPNKFLAKIASDWKKPDGLFVIQPEEIDSFLSPLPVGRLPGVGKVTEEKLKAMAIDTVADLRKLELPTLESRFGRYGVRLYELARGVDETYVIPNRPTQSISAEDTFEQDVLLSEMEPMIRKLAEKTWEASRNEPRLARTVVLKLKTTAFKILTRSHTPAAPPSSCGELTSIALSLRDRVGLDAAQRFRLVGVGLSNFVEPRDGADQRALFE